MKKLTALLLACTLFLGILPLMAQASEPVKLTMGSWRSDDTAQVNMLLAKYKEKTGVEIVFEPTIPNQYNATLRMQLDNKTGPDLMYARSFATGQELFEAGFLMDLTGLEGLEENFPVSALEGWRSKDGKMFGVPYAAVSQIAYYNKGMFAENGWEVPKTFEEFLALAQAIKDKNIEPLANGIASNWDILECVFLGMLPNYVGGAEERAKYESGEKKMNDEAFLKALTDFAALTKFFPEGFEAINNEDGPAMFGLGRAAMFIDGSWTMGMFKEYDVDVGYFAIPAPEGKTPGLCFHTDMGLAGNASTQHPEEVKAFLAWMASPEGAKAAAVYLPAGFFPMMAEAGAMLTGDDVKAVQALNEGKVLDTRFIWNKLMAMYTPMVDQLNLLARGETTPEAAAEVFAAEQAKALGK